MFFIKLHKKCSDIVIRALFISYGISLMHVSMIFVLFNGAFVNYYLIFAAVEITGG